MKPKKPTKTIDQNILSKKPWILEDVKILALKDKIEVVAIPLKDWKDVKIYRGILTGLNDVFIIDTKTKDEILKRCVCDSEKERTSKVIKPILKGRDIKRYKFKWNDLWVIGTFPPLNLDIEEYHSIKNYLLSFGKQRLEQSGLKGSRKLTKHKWFETQDQTAYYKEFDKEKIVWAEMTRQGRFIFASKDMYCDQTCYIMTDAPKYFVPILNSKLIQFYLELYCAQLGSNANRWTKQYVELLPIPRLNPNIPSEKETYDRLSELSLEMMELHKVDTKDEKQKEQVTDRIYEVDSEINRIVYKLYQLTDDEIELIEDKL